MRTLLLLLAMLLSMTTVAQIPFEDMPTNLPATTHGSLEAGDVNNDGYMDYLQTGSIDHPVGEYIPKTILSFGDANGNVTENTTHNFPDVMNGGGLFADVDNDGDLDAFVFGRKANNQKVAEIHLNDGNGNFTFHQSLTGMDSSRAVFGHLNNDGYPDLVYQGLFTGIDYDTKMYRNDNGIFTEVANIFKEMYGGDIAIFDYDNDGHNDVLLTGNDPSNFYAKLYKNNGNNFDFFEISNIFVPNGSGSSIAIADIDNDGDLDVGMSGDTFTGPITHIYLNNGDGTFTLAQELTGVWFGDIILKDINKDGFPDTFIVGITNYNGGQTAKFYLNDGTETMVYNRAFSPGLGGASAVIVDMDNDSYMDIIYTGSDGAPFQTPFIKVWKNMTLGIEDFTQDQVVVYPNPTRGLVNIELPNDIFVTDFSVTDMSGKQFKVSHNGTQIDLSSLANGMYLLTINSEDGQTITKRIIKN